MKKIIFVLAIIVCFVFSMSTEAQKRETSTKDMRIIKNRPSVYISFEREGNRKPLHTGDSNKGVWLRLHNNSKWRIWVCMWDVPKEYGEKELTYEVERYEKSGNCEETPLSTDPEGSCPLELMKPGESVLFSVPREHLAEGLAIKVNFLYEWDIDSDGSISDLEPKHYVYFYSSQIPKNNSGQSKQKRRAKQKRRE
ncbi:MAG: hypothetical protein D6735_11040 [Acidobacteria bacterium]|nr:MAG: hypothetical protein D6735_11040 [Acidobacteriota bacterium]